MAIAAFASQQCEQHDVSRKVLGPFSQGSSAGREVTQKEWNNAGLLWSENT
jgi:hypothetical protein